MLVLSRRIGESIVIGEDIVVSIVDIRHDRVRLGIDAPRETSVHRSEVFEKVQKEKKDAEAKEDKK